VTKEEGGKEMQTATRTETTWEDVATCAAQGSSQAFLRLMDRFGTKGALAMTRLAREVLREAEADPFDFLATEYHS
jgi:hypothetical protein